MYDAVVKEFGIRIIGADQAIDRRILGEIVFNDPQARARLNSLVHPAVIARQREWLKEVEAQDPGGVAIVDAALMIEAGTYRNYDKLIVVICEPEIQKQRLRARSGLSEDQIEARIRSQMPMEEKAKYANYIIETSGSIESTASKLRASTGNCGKRRECRAS